MRVRDVFIEHCEVYGYCDLAYAEKLLNQGLELPKKQREEFQRKVKLLLTAMRSSKFFHEIAGYVNDCIIRNKSIEYRNLKEYD